MKLLTFEKKYDGWFFSWIPRWAKDREGNLHLVCMQYLYRYVIDDNAGHYKYYTYDYHDDTEPVERSPFIKCKKE